MSELQKIPNVGKRTEDDLLALGYTTIDSLKGIKAEELYKQECELRGCLLDKCQLYLLRAVEYFVNTDKPNLDKCKWWYWKDEFIEVAPCGTICSQCDFFPIQCKGCRQIKGKVFWTKFTNDECCKVYDCCVNKKKQKNCSQCSALPCERFTKDPTISDEQNNANLKIMLNNLKNSKNDK